jgi:hypothetical protein
VRQVCEVDYVEIFPKSTSGWVRVKGCEHFKAAFGTKPATPYKKNDCTRWHARSHNFQRI